MDDIYKISTLKLKKFFIITAIIMAFLNIHNNRFFQFGDTMTYLDMADNFMQNGWEGLINGYWSPLYPFLVAITKSLITFPEYSELVMIKYLNFVIFIFTLFCFDHLLNQLIKFNKWINSSKSSELHTLPDQSIVIIGYSIFIWSQILIGVIWKGAPDLLFSTWIYLAYFLFLKIQMGNKSKLTFVYLGLILGLAFLTKGFGNIFIIFFLLFIFSVHNNFKQALTHAGITLITLLVTIGPYVYALSNYKGFFTLGETAKIYYAMFINNVKPYYHWQGECNLATTNCQKIGKPKHPTIKIVSNPNTFSFDNVFNATLPTWYDISYWYEGVTPYFDIKGHLRGFKQHKNETKEIFFGTSNGLFIFISFLFLIFLSRRGKAYFIDLRNYLYLLIPSLLILTIIIFTWTYSRYMGEFIILTWLSLFSAIRFPALTNKDLAQKIKIGTFLALLVLLINAYTTLKTTYIQIKEKPYYPHADIARYLKKIGINKGDKIARIYRLPRKIDWARLAKVMIIAEVDSREGYEFWKATNKKQTEILNAFKNAGALVVVSRTAPYTTARQGWQKIGQTGHYVYDLRK